MFRLISWLIYMMTNQQKRESSEYLWMVYEKVKYSQKKWEQNLYGCILHRIFRENGANIPIETEFADYPVFPHGPSGVFISQGAKNWKKLRDFSTGDNRLQHVERSVKGLEHQQSAMMFISERAPELLAMYGSVISAELVQTVL